MERHSTEVSILGTVQKEEAKYMDRPPYSITTTHKLLEEKYKNIKHKDITLHT